jgi:hypothetical protein
MRADAWERWLRREPAYPEEKIARLVSAIRHGVEIGYEGDRERQRTFPRNSPTTEDPRVAALISEAIATDVQEGYKSGPHDQPPFTPFHVSPLSGVPKGDNGEKIRVIHNLSHPFGGDSINSGIPREPYLMMCFEDALAGIRRLGRGTLLSKFDIRAAFKLVPVRPADRPLLGLIWQGKYYYECVLPFGLRTSGYRWEEFAAALHYLCKHRLGIHLVVHYVDDFLFIAAPGHGALAQEQRAAFQRMCAELGVPLADEKTLGPVQELSFLGVELDTDRMECRLTAKRVEKLRSRLQDWVSQGSDLRVTCDELMSMVGKLEFATIVVRAGTAFLRRLRAIMMSMKNQRAGGSSEKRRLSNEARIEVRWWLDVFLTAAGNRRPIVDPPWVEDASMDLYTDACGTGYGACFGNRWFQGRWTAEQLDFARVHTHISMPYLELHALTRAAVAWGHLWTGRRITFRCDAEAAVTAVQRMRSRRDSMSALLRILYATSVRHGFEFRCVHVAGVTNIVADALSRGCSLQELRAVLPGADAEPTPAPPLPTDGEPMVAWKEERDPPPADSPPSPH